MEAALLYASGVLPKPFEGVRILTVDDEADGLEALAVILRLLGAEVECAPTATWALSKLREFQPNVLIADLRMPRHDGFELLSELRARPAELGGLVPAVAFSALDSPEARARAHQAGFQRFLAKPVALSELITAIGSLVAN